MSRLVDGFNQRKRKLEEVKSQVDRFEGALAQVMTDLRERHGVKTIEEGTKKLKEMEERLTKTVDKFNQAYAEFEQEWSDKLEDK